MGALSGFETFLSARFEFTIIDALAEKESKGFKKPFLSGRGMKVDVVRSLWGTPFSALLTDIADGH